MQRIDNKILKNKSFELSEGSEIKFCDLRNSTLIVLGKTRLFACLVDKMSFIGSIENIEFERCFTLQDDFIIEKTSTVVHKFNSEENLLLNQILTHTNPMRGVHCRNLISIIESKKKYDLTMSFGVLFLYAGFEWEVKTMIINFLIENEELFSYSHFNFNKELFSLVLPLLFDDEYFVRDATANFIRKYNPSVESLNLHERTYLNQYNIQNVVLGVNMIKENEDYMLSVNPSWLIETLFKLNSIETILACIGIMKCRCSLFGKVIYQFFSTHLRNVEFSKIKYSEDVLLEVLLFLQGAECDNMLELEDFLYLLNYNDDLIESALICAWNNNFEKSDEIKLFVEKNKDKIGVQKFLKYVGY